MKVVVLGCTHAGTAAVLNTVALHKDAQVRMVAIKKSIMRMPGIIPATKRRPMETSPTNP